MRKRPKLELLQNKFIDAASTNVEETSTHITSLKAGIEVDYNDYVSKLIWPLDKEDILPSYADGCLLKKPLSININEKEWNTIDRHVKTLGVTKDKWVKRAIFKQLYLEQMTAFKAKE